MQNVNCHNIRVDLFVYKWILAVEGLQFCHHHTQVFSAVICEGEVSSVDMHSTQQQRELWNPPDHI